MLSKYYKCIPLGVYSILLLMKCCYQFDVTIFAAELSRKKKTSALQMNTGISDNRTKTRNIIYQYHFNISYC